MAGRRKNSGGALKYIILIVMLGIVLIGVFLVLNRNKGKQQSDEENMLLSRVQEITTMNLDARYPPTERDAVSFFGRCMQVLYNEEVTDPDIDAVAEQLLKIYDDELIGNQANYPMQLHREVKNMKTDGYTIQNYVVVDKNRVQPFKDENGNECAGVECTFSIRNGTQLQSVIYVFICRKDASTGRWKIVGWQPKEDQSVNLFGW
ncbi:MAG: hypothetical protein II868_00440 [Butyrivibrio sp.]|nr:hypothetical protein [Butyrivibrio sp.]